jgi:hypothetical protein
MRRGVPERDLLLERRAVLGALDLTAQVEDLPRGPRYRRRTAARRRSVRPSARCPCLTCSTARTTRCRTKRPSACARSRSRGATGRRSCRAVLVAAVSDWIPMLPSAARPSIVVTSPPRRVTASVRQASTRRPSTHTGERTELRVAELKQPNARRRRTQSEDRPRGSPHMTSPARIRSPAHQRQPIAATADDATPRSSLSVYRSCRAATRGATRRPPGAGRAITTRRARARSGTHGGDARRRRAAARRGGRDAWEGVCAPRHFTEYGVSAARHGASPEQGKSSASERDERDERIDPAQ